MGWHDALEAGELTSAASAYESKRFGVSSMNQGVTWPSMEMPLSSYRAISLLSFQAPARALASWLMPSIRQPSPKKV